MMSKKVKTQKKPSQTRRATLTFLILAAVGLLLMLLIPSTVKRLRFAQKQSVQEGFIKTPLRGQDPAVTLCEDLVVQRWLSWRHCRVVECSIYAKPTEGRRDQLEKLVKTHDQQIRDNLQTIIANADTSQLMDPTLAYVKRCTRHSLSTIDTEGLTEKILIPEWKTYRP